MRLVAAVDGDSETVPNWVLLGVVCRLLPCANGIRAGVECGIGYVPRLLRTTSGDDVDQLSASTINGCIDKGDNAAAEDGCRCVAVGQ
jgi:hypothetical protein